MISFPTGQGSCAQFILHKHTIPNCSAEHILALFADIEHKPYSFLLDSCQQTHMGGRYDIIASEPCLTYEFTRSKWVIAGEFAHASSLRSDVNIDFPHLFCAESLNGSCPYLHLAQLQARFNSLFDIPAFEDVNLPFIIGALSVFAYDGNISTDNIPDKSPAQYAIPDISVGFYHSSLIYDNHTRSLHIFSIDSEFITRHKNRLITLQKGRDEHKANHNKASKPFALLEPWQANMSESMYHQQFTKIEDYLRAGDCYQVNFAQRFHARYCGSEWLAYCRLRRANNAPFSAYVRLPTSVVLSLSPERFLRVKDAQVETKPIKGTRKRSADPLVDKALSDELLSAQKDRAENLMIVDLLRNDLSKHCVAHSVKVPQLFALESYPAVHHMVSTVVGTLKPNASAYDLLKGAFPGGSITGAPKVRAMQIIQEIEPDKRAIYCGSIGYVGVRGDMDTNICIRTLLAQQDPSTHETQHTGIIYCWAGGGIVIDSKSDDEYLESLHKVAKILPVLNIVSGDDQCEGVVT